MPILTTVSKLASEFLLLLVTLTDIHKLFQTNDIKEEVLKYEKLRRDAISRHQRKISGDIVHKNTKQRSTILPRTGGVLLKQNGVNDESHNQDVGSGEHTSKSVRYELGAIRSRKRVFNNNNGG